MHTKKLVAAAAIALAGTLLAGCSGGGNGGGGNAPAESDPKAPLTIWTDTTRTDQAKAYAAEHPETTFTIETIDDTQGTNTTKLALAEKAGSGIPDVVFLGTPDEIASIAANPINYPMALDGLVPKDVLGGFPDGTISRCTYGGKVYCLGNDIGQTVLWYNKALFDEWGYPVPTTFDEFRDLGVAIGRDHPGYSIGTVNGHYGVDAFFGSSGCPMYDSTDPTTVKIDLSSEKCSRVGDVIGPLIANHTLLNYDPFDKTYTQLVTDGKVVATIGASWEGPFVFEAMDSDAAGKYAAAPMPSWTGEDTNYSGAIGGGIWIVSNKTKNAKAAVDFVTDMVTNKDIAKAAVTYPAYSPSRDVWLENISADPFWAADPADALKDAAGKINPSIGYVRYTNQMLDSYNDLIAGGDGSDIQDALITWGEQITKLAESTGYTVSK
jgi:ABC-type glycerol-3-phosphate transport system substrate-binding protein